MCTHSEQVGTTLVARQQAAAATVAETQEAAEPVEAAPELLVAEIDGVQVRFQDGCHEAKVGEIAGCQTRTRRHVHPSCWHPATWPAALQSGSSARYSWRKPPGAEHWR